jgi:hypothetical protein
MAWTCRMWIRSKTFGFGTLVGSNFLCGLLPVCTVLYSKVLKTSMLGTILTWQIFQLYFWKFWSSKPWIRIGSRSVSVSGFIWNVGSDSGLNEPGSTTLTACMTKGFAKTSALYPTQHFLSVQMECLRIASKHAENECNLSEKIRTIFSDLVSSFYTLWKYWRHTTMQQEG